MCFQLYQGLGSTRNRLCLMFDWFLFFLCLSRMFDWYLMSKMRVECLEFSANFFGSLCVSSLPYNQTRTRKLYLENLRPFAFLYICLPSCLSVLVSFGFSRKFLHIFIPLLVLRLLLSDWESCLAGKHSWSWEAMTLAHPPWLQRHQNKYQNSDITPVLFEMTFPLFSFVVYSPEVFFLAQ